MRKKLINTFFIALLIVFLGACGKQNKIELRYANGQIGVLTNSKQITIDGIDYDTYKTVDSKLVLSFESFNMKDNFANYLIINEEHHQQIKPEKGTQNEYVKTEIELLNLNIVDGNLKVSFHVGENKDGIKDTFWLKNVVIKLDSKTIKADQDLVFDYQRVVRIGSKDLKSHLRTDYVEVETFDFTIDSKALNKRGLILTNNDQTIIINDNKKEYQLNNPAFLDIQTNLDNDELLTKSRTVDILYYGDILTSHIYLNGVLIDNNLKLTNTAWASGINTIEIIALNKYGFVLNKTITFELSNDFLSYEELDFKAYNLGLEVAKGLKKGLEIEEVKDYRSKFSDVSQIQFEVFDSANKNIIWTGKTLPNRTVYLQLYNYDVEKWETKSTMIYREGQITLGYNYEDDNQYLKAGIVNVRVLSENLFKERLTDTYIYHITDVQYISRNGTIEAIKSTAFEAFAEMQNHIKDVFNQDMLKYILMTGDFVQSTVKTGDIEWPIVMDHLITPLLDYEIPLGTVSGNHDIGALSENTSEGIDTLDDDLIYDLYEQYLGDHVFSDKPYFIESFENNRSHYDLLTINGHEFLFLYLGWGSSIKGIHVSEKDINFGKSVLERYPDKTVVIALHEYMGNRENKTLTGMFVYQKLVKPYSNVKFVISGHINGTSAIIDYLDDNGDGLVDRKVLQLLTNFQEEALDNLGATFIRRIGLDFTNNRLSFDLYSPVANDYQIFVGSHGNIVRKYTDFEYDFDLSNYDYGLITSGLGIID
ncbi:MAG: hypothetical protein GX149_00585 [Acholeplasmataceae bacterium]|jgi:hypothetical protein|nr:hypothetical protein [Acholeplasmataceae bacterium]